MKFIYLALLTFSLLVSSYSHAQFDRYIDLWNSIAIIQGQFNKTHTVFQQAKCNPCDYSIILYRDYVQLLLDNPKKGNQDNILAFEFKVVDSHYEQSIWDFDKSKLKLNTKNDLNQFVQRVTRQGVQWSYELTLPIQGLLLKGHSSTSYQTLIPIVTFLFSILIFIAFPLTTTGRQQQVREIPRRTPLVSLLIIAHLQHFILIEVVVMSIKYLIHEESFLTKSLWYAVFMIPFGFTILHILYIYDAIRLRFIAIFEKVQSARIKDISLVVTFLGGVYLVGLGLLLANKGMWIYGYFAFYLMWQIGQSIYSKVYPYLNLTAYFFLLLGYQMFLSTYEPLFWFDQLTRKEIVIYWAVIIGVFIVGSVLQKIFIGIEKVNQVLFEQSRNMEMNYTGSAKSTEANLDT